MSETGFVSYADDNTLCKDDVTKSLDNDSINLSKWFLDNKMKANSDKRVALSVI